MQQGGIWCAGCSWCTETSPRPGRGSHSGTPGCLGQESAPERVQIPDQSEPIGGTEAPGARPGDGAGAPSAWEELGVGAPGGAPKAPGARPGDGAGVPSAWEELGVGAPGGAPKAPGARPGDGAGAPS